MNELFQQQVNLWQLTRQTSLSCCRSMNLRSELFASKPPFDSQVTEESFKMINEKISLSAEIALKISSIDSLHGSVQTYTDILTKINHKAIDNVNRLSAK